MCTGNCTGGCSQSTCCTVQAVVTLPAVIGPPGPQGPPGTTVIHSSTPSFSTNTTGVDVLVTNPDSTVAMPTGTQLGINALPTNGSYLIIELLWQSQGPTAKTGKMQIGSSGAFTLFNVTSVPGTDFKTRIKAKRISATQMLIEVETLFLTSFGYLPIGMQLVNNLTTATNDIRFFINQSAAATLVLVDVTISKAIL